MTAIKYTKQQFIDKVHLTPFSLSEIAGLACECADEEIRVIGNDFLNAEGELVNLLDDLKIEVG
jgi:hypothetical protein